MKVFVAEMKQYLGEVKSGQKLELPSLKNLISLKKNCKNSVPFEFVHNV